MSSLASFRHAMDPYNFSRLKEVIAQSQADARRAALELACKRLDERAETHRTTARYHDGDGLGELREFWLSVARETDKCAREVRALLGDAGRAT